MKCSGKRNALIAVIAVSLIGILFCAQNASAAFVLKAKEEAHSVHGISDNESDMGIPEALKPADVVFDKYKIDIFGACANASSRISWYGETQTKLGCRKHKYGADSLEWLPFEKEEFGSSYAITTVDGDTSLENPHNHNIGGYFVIKSPKAATDVTTGKVYDVRMTISNIKIRRRVCAAGDGDDTETAILYSYSDTSQVPTTGDNSRPVWVLDGVSYFTGQSVTGHNRCRSGAKYDVKVELYDGNTKVSGKTMFWSSNDIDIGDRLGEDSDYYYQYDDTNHTYAEHIKLKSGYDIAGNYVSMTESGYNQLALNSNNVIYHKFTSSSTTSSVDNNSCSALFKANMDNFTFEWGGSQCGTTIDSVPFSMFDGRTYLSYGGSNVGPTYSVTVNGPTSDTVSFKHQIKRTKVGSKASEDEYYIIDKTKLSTLAPYSEKGSKRFTSNMHDYHTVDSSKFTVDLDPGQTKVISEQLHFRASDVNETNYRDVEKNSITLTRPPAYFNGSLSASVRINGGTDVSMPSNHVINLSDTDDGRYEITFNNVINRRDESGRSAGGTVKTQYKTGYRVNESVPGAAAVTWSPSSPKTLEADTSALEDGGSYPFSVKASGTLKYGETRTICQSMDYRAKQMTGNALTAASGSEYCVTIKRPMKKCDIDTSYAFGLISGKTIAQLSVRNKDLDRTARTSISSPDSVSIYARPTDKIQFSYGMCAGSLYPIIENGVSATVSYTASGTSTKAGAINNDNKYLFRTEVPLVSGTYNNPRTWSSASPVGNFLKDSNPDNLIGTFTSPSAGAGTNYHCGYMSNSDSGYYQVAGTEDCARTGAYDIDTLDVGSTITQKLEWNERPVTNGTNVGDVPRTASADVVIPYNYELKPYVTNGTARAAYIGETIKMYPGVAVMTRKNEQVYNQTYATISKNTEVKYRYYFTSSNGVLKGSIQTAHETETRRFNQNGFLSQSANEALDTITIEIDDTHEVGDRVCVELSVYPFESHDGTNDTAVALKEVSNISTRRATASCLAIAKRPTMSVESSNVYSATNIMTSYYDKKTTADNGIQKQFYFGSWSEYGVFGRVNKNFLMASGAAFGYIRDDSYDEKALNIGRVNPQYDYKVAQPTNSNECTFMTQTFANAECKQNESAKRIGNISAEQYESRMLDRYADTGSSNLSGVQQKQYSNVTYLDASNIDPTSATYYNASSNLTSVRGNNIYLSKTPSFANDDNTHNRTIVYHATNLIIDGDLNNETAKSMTNLGDITGVVIFADNVYITDRVHYINAAVIAKEVNTCAFRYHDPTKRLKQSDLSSGICNSNIVFDQPVVTKRLILNRTSGASRGTNSIMRAEVFNLNSANFLWSFGQMSRYNQAITTFSRELPPRY